MLVPKVLTLRMSCTVGFGFSALFPEVQGSEALIRVVQGSQGSAQHLPQNTKALVSELFTPGSL